jgi:hypothetical protein
LLEKEEWYFLEKEEPRKWKASKREEASMTRVAVQKRAQHVKELNAVELLEAKAQHALER